MIKKIKASRSEKIIFFFLISLAIFSLSSFFLIKNKCLFVKNYNPKKLSFNKPLVKSKAYNDVAFHRVIKDSLVQAGDLEFGKKGNIDYGKIGTGQSGLGTIKSEVDVPFNYERGSVGLARTQKYNTEDSQFFITLKDEPLYESEYTPIGKVIYGIEALEKIKYLNKSEYVLRPDFINSIKMLVD